MNCRPVIFITKELHKFNQVSSVLSMGLWNVEDVVLIVSQNTEESLRNRGQEIQHSGLQDANDYRRC